MAEDRGVIHTIAWQEVFPSLRLLGALRTSVSARALVLSAVAIVGTVAGWRLLGDAFASPEDPPASAFQESVQANGIWPWDRGIPGRPVDNILSVKELYQSSPLAIAWTDIAAPFRRVFAAEASFTELVYWLCCALWALAVWSFFGGAISRMAAVNIARQENLAWGPLAGFVRGRFAAYFLAPLFPIMGTFMAAALLALVGLLLNADFGVLVAGILWPIVLLFGFLMAFMLVATFFSWPLMWAAISTEGTDTFGALSHSYSYAYQRPLQYFLYALAAAAIGILGWFIVSLLAEWTILLAGWGVSWGAGGARLNEVLGTAELSGPGRVGRWLILFWNNALWMLALGFVFSYFWTATTAIYFLLRRHVDATEIEEIYLPEEQELHGLPPLKTGPDGVPEIADTAAPAREEP